MIIPFKGKIYLILEDKPLKLDSKLENKIQEYWQNIQNNMFYEGNTLAVTKVLQSNDSYIFKLAKTKFSALVYSSYKEDLKIYSFFCAALFKTSDNYYVLCKNNFGVINLIGGLLEKTDLTTENPFISCLEREIKEELMLNSQNYKVDIENIYLKTPYKEEGDSKLWHYF